MVTITPMLKLRQPAFDQDPWDEDVNGNFAILDAAVGTFYAIPNFTGLWRNSTAYTGGQVAVDIADSSQWSCLVAHTSATSPTLFAADRLAHPSYWANTVADISSLVAQAAASATSAFVSAAGAAASAATAADMVPLSGGFMTGALVLSGNPSVALGAATKDYVDNATGGAAYLPLTGGTVTGNLTVDGALVGGTRVKSTGSAGGVPTVYAYNGDSVGAGFSTLDDSAMTFYTYDSGGTPTFSRGYLTATGAFYAAASVATPLVQSTGPVQWYSSQGGVEFASNITKLRLTVDNWRIAFNHVTGRLSYYSAANVELFYILPGSAGGVLEGWGVGGNLGVAGSSFLTNTTVTGNLTVTGTAAKPGGGAWADSSDERIKWDIKSYNSGLAELVALDPVFYKKKDNHFTAFAPSRNVDESRQHIGLIAQHAEEHMPEMFTRTNGIIDGESVNDFRIYDSTALVYAMINAFKEVDDRLKDLEMSAT